jgi:hypothetical protein
MEEIEQKNHALSKIYTHKPLKLEVNKLINSFKFNANDVPKRYKFA